MIINNLSTVKITKKYLDDARFQSYPSGPDTICSGPTGRIVRVELAIVLVSVHPTASFGLPGAPSFLHSRDNSKGDSSYP